MNEPPAPLTTAALAWADGQPLSTTFGDVYYSREDGLAESRHVFIEGNDLAARWEALAPDGRFTLMETGFGTGLNFLAAISLWLERAPAGARLHYVSFEKFPLQRADLTRALAAWPTLSPLARELADAYPPPVPGFHRRWLYGDRVCLTLVFDDAIAGLDSLAGSDHPAFGDAANPRADAWFLDGFAPAKNPDLWSPALFAAVARLSGPGTTASTFTVARPVRDGLQGAGFALAKAPGFGRKRDMLRAIFAATAAPSAAPDAPRAPAGPGRRRGAFQPPWHLPPEPHRGSRHALVVGGGIAGCASANALLRRGWQVTLVERHGHLGAEASGNPQGILYPRLSVEDSTLARFARAALCHALGVYPPLWSLPGQGAPCGVLVLPESDRDRAHMAAIAERYRFAPELVRQVAGEALDTVAGIPLAAPEGLYFPRLGWVVPPTLCAALAAGATRVQAEVERLDFDTHTRRWQLVDANGTAIASAPVVILACAQGLGRFAQTRHLPLRGIRGQISAVAVNDRSRMLKTVICGAGYLAPANDGLHTLGATYDLDDPDTGVRPDDHRRNLATLAATDGALADLFGEPAQGGRAALRCTTPDYLPVAGPAPRAAELVATYAELGRDARRDIPVAGPCWPGLWINGGHGSRGLTYAPLAAELIASGICGEPAPLPRGLAIALHPARFLIRDLKRNRLADRDAGKEPR